MGDRGRDTAILPLRVLQGKCGDIFQNTLMCAVSLAILRGFP